ncbi:CAAX amino terminal protease family protein [alpha proteobacterium U9-1i]|nr:CAAX amino terminal protease family protein [alpha proteobacterium U9-1i]
MKAILWFLAISFLPAWITWEIAIASGLDVLSWQMQLCLVPGACCPAVATFVVRKWITHEGFDDVKLRFSSGRWLLYIFAWLLPLLVVAGMAAFGVALGLGTPDFSLSQAIAAQSVGRDLSMMEGVGLLIVPQVLLVALVTTPILFGEEFGWRGFLQRRLFPNAPAVSALVTGLIWGVWHYPLILRGYNYPDQPLLGAALFTVFTILISYVFGWFYRRSGSIWCNSLAHAATNTVGSLSLLWLAGMGGPIIISYGGALALLPLAALTIVLALIDRFQPATAPPLPIRT